MIGHNPVNQAETSQSVPPEAVLLKKWRQRADVTRTELARRISALADNIGGRLRRVPESTLRNMERGRPGSLRPAWRLAAAALVCGGTAQELAAAMRQDAARELEDLCARHARRARRRRRSPRLTRELALPGIGRLVVDSGLPPDDLEVVERAVEELVGSVRGRLRDRSVRHASASATEAGV